MTARLRTPFPWPLLRFFFRRILLMWCLITAMIFLFQLAVCGVVHDNEQVKTFLGFIELLPAFAKAALGGDTLQVGNVDALIAIGYQHPAVFLLFMIFAVAVPTGLLAGEVQQGRMELILSRAATKTQVYVCVGVLTVAGMFAMVVLMFLGTVIGVHLYRFDQQVNPYPFFIAAINGGLLASTVGAISLLSAAICRRRGTAVGLAVSYLVVSYVVSVFADWWPPMKPLGPWTPFYYVDGPKIFSEAAWPLGNMSVLLAILLIAAVIGGIVWHRRDLPL